MKSLLERLHGARHIGLIAGLVALALLALVLTNARDMSRGTAGETSLERRLEQLLARIDGVGRVNVMITEDGEGTIIGAVVVAEGLQDIRPALEIQTAVRTLLRLDADQVRIIGRQGSYGGALQ